VSKYRQREVKRSIHLVAGAVLALVCFCILVPDSFGSGGQDRWLNVSLEHGETASGYAWATGARIRKGSKLTDVCTAISVTEPQQDDAPYVEGIDAADCGSLRHPAETVVSFLPMGRNAFSVGVVEALYRPVVRKVRVDLSTGEKKVFLPRAVRLSRGDKGVVPIFRYLVLTLEGQICIRRMLSYDHGGRLIEQEKPEGSRSCLLGSS